MAPPTRCALLGLLVAIVLTGGTSRVTGAQPAGNATPPVPATGAPGMLWGRLAVEEESPAGPTTPVVGAEVRLYPYRPRVASELEQIRDQARNSGADYEAAVDRLLRRLQAYETELSGAGSTGGGPSLVKKQTTDASGLFAFDPVPSGEWLVVVLHLGPYTATRRAPRPSGGEETFLPKPATVAKEAALWVSRVRVEPGERSRLLLTERSRFMVGPAH